MVKQFIMESRQMIQIQMQNNQMAILWGQVLEWGVMLTLNNL